MSETEFTAERVEKILGKVRGLLAKADDPASTPQEADLFRTKAEELMRRYRIAEEQALAVDPQALAPEWMEIDITEAGQPEFAQEYFTMWWYIADHAGVRFRQGYRRGSYFVQAVGYPADLKLAELLYTNARLGFSARLTPGVDPNLSEEENIYRLRSAGVVRGRVAEMLWGGQTHARNARVGTVYKAECAKRGEVPALDGRGTSAKLHREVYAKEFAAEIARRLRRSRDAADRSGGLPALHGRAERVAEALYKRYPEERPSTEVAPHRECDKCAKRKDGSKCSKHTHRPPTKAQMDRYYRENSSATAVAAKAAGRKAAGEVALDGSAPVRRVDSRSAEERDTERAIRGILEG